MRSVLQRLFKESSFLRITDSLLGLLNRSSNTETIQVERIRVAMLNAMDAYCGDAHLEIDGPLQFARDIETLWYLRPDLLQAIASSSDQHTATLIIRDITMMFKGHYAAANSLQKKSPRCLPWY
jgi:hypothetical protein